MTHDRTDEHWIDRYARNALRHAPFKQRFASQLSELEAMETDSFRYRLLHYGGVGMALGFAQNKDSDLAFYGVMLGVFLYTLGGILLKADERRALKIHQGMLEAIVDEGISSDAVVPRA